MINKQAFPFYPDEWLSSTEIALMTMSQQGAYIHLLCNAWKLGGVLPYNPEQILKLSRLSTIDELEPVLKMFVEKEVGYVNPKLQREYDKMIAKSNKARVSADIRWHCTDRKAK